MGSLNPSYVISHLSSMALPNGELLLFTGQPLPNLLAVISSPFGPVSCAINAYSLLMLPTLMLVFGLVPYALSVEISVRIIRSSMVLSWANMVKVIEKMSRLVSSVFILVDFFYPNIAQLV